jgi:hypothetical protein
MKISRKIKTFESYEKTGQNVNRPDPSDEEINFRIKEIVEGLVRIKIYMQMLEDTTEKVYDMLDKQFPPNIDAFMNALYSKDEFLAGLVEDLSTTFEMSEAVDNIKEMNATLSNIKEYIDGNWSVILSGKNATEEDEEDDDEEDDDEGSEEDIPEEDEDEDDGNEYIDIMKVKGEPEDQLKRKRKVNEQRKPTLADLQKKMSQYTKKREESSDKFKSGDVVYISGIKGHASVYNGRKCTVIRKNKEKEDCYDLYDATIKASKDGVNMEGVPSEYLSKEPPKTKKPRIAKIKNE